MPAMAQHKPFLKLFESMMSKRNAWEVWSDWVECLAISIANRVDTVAAVEREETYKRIIQRYDAEEQATLTEMASTFFEAMETDPCQDYLGSLFMCLALSSHWHGQFFTPYSMCAAMVRLQLVDSKTQDIIAKKGYVSLCDPACGAGATLIAARNELNTLGISPDNAWFVAQDIDRTAGLMCYLQLAILGCAGYVCIGNTLTDPTTTDGTFLPVHKQGNDIWYLPYTYMGAWPGRVMWARMNQALDDTNRNSNHNINHNVEAAAGSVPEQTNLIKENKENNKAKIKENASRKPKKTNKLANEIKENNTSKLKKNEVVTAPLDQELPGQLSIF